MAEMRFRGGSKRRASRSVPPKPLDGWKREALSATLAEQRGAEEACHASGARKTSAFVDEVRFASASGRDLLEIPRRTASSQTFSLEAGHVLRWEFRVRSHDVGFSLRRRTMRCGGAVEEDLIDARRYPAGVGVVGDWTARESCQVVARFDNEYSIFTAKRVRAGAAGG